MILCYLFAPSTRTLNGVFTDELVTSMSNFGTVNYLYCPFALLVEPIRIFDLDTGRYHKICFLEILHRDRLHVYDATIFKAEQLLIP